MSLPIVQSEVAERWLGVPCHVLPQGVHLYSGRTAQSQVGPFIYGDGGLGRPGACDTLRVSSAASH